MKNPYLNSEFFSRLETSALNLRSSLAGFFGGKHLVKTYGQTVEFADYREYMLGDDIRRIDWNLYSRFEKYFLKLFTDERQMHTRIFLDCSASMGKDNPTKAAYAIGFAAAIGFLSVHNMDKLSIRLIRGDKAVNPFGTIVGKNAFYRAVGELENVTFDGDCDIEKAIVGCDDQGQNDGLTIIISDFFTDSDWRKAVEYLGYKKRQVILAQVLSPEDIDPTYTGRVTLIDSESEDVEDARNMRINITRGMQIAYEQALYDYIAEIRSYCVTHDVGVATIRCNEPIEKAIFGQLMNLGITE